MDLLHRDFRTGIVLIQAPEQVLLLHCAVILVDAVLHQIENQGSIQIWTPRSIPNPHGHADISVHQWIKHGTLLFKHLGVVQGFLAFDQEFACPSSAVGLAGWLTQYGESDR